MKLLKQLIINLRIIGSHLAAQSPADGLAKEKVRVINQLSDRLGAVRRNLAGINLSIRN